jgi:hypothetical protein
MTIIGLRITLPQFQELIDVFDVIMMEDSSDLAADK